MASFLTVTLALAATVTAAVMAFATAAAAAAAVLFAALAAALAALVAAAHARAVALVSRTPFQFFLVDDHESLLVFDRGLFHFHGRRRRFRRAGAR